MHGPMNIKFIDSKQREKLLVTIAAKSAEIWIGYLPSLKTDYSSVGSVCYKGQQEPYEEVWFPTVTEPSEDFWSDVPDFRSRPLPAREINVYWY